MPIRALPPLLVNQIAAGEVVERPASVVKELLENAIDAGARRVEVGIEQGGKALVRVTDDGAGIPFDELELAAAPHATSKIVTVEDLAAIATLGFRGEALASIGSVSRMSILSRPREQPEGGRVEVESASIGAPRPDAAPPGSTITVRNLFFNTPARRKFLRTDQTEAARVRETVESLAMVHPSIGFRLMNERRAVLELPPDQSPTARALALLGPELAPEMLEIDASEGGIGLWGLLGRPAVARGNARHLLTFLNGRPIRDRAVMHAVREGYRGLIAPERSPTVVLMLVMDPAQVDVNVHPTKFEVRFRQPAAVHRAVRTAVQRRLQEADLLPRLDLERAAAPFGSGHASRPEVAQVIEQIHRLAPEHKGFVYTEVKAALAAERPELIEPERVWPPGAGPAAETPLPRLQPADAVMQVQSSYLVTQDERGLIIIDQHALHERVMFELLKRRLTRGTLEAQRLLMPATVEVDQERLEQLERLADLLARLGIEAEPIGPRAIAIHAFTSLLFERNVDPVDFMSELLTRAVERDLPAEPEAALHEVMDMMACKAAVKAGDRLTPAELADLLRQRETIERASSCPHGRPTSLRLTIEDLDRQFGRR